MSREDLLRVMLAIPLSGRRGRGQCAVVDIEDAKTVGEGRWHLGGPSKGYAMARKGDRIVCLHRLILGLDFGDGFEVDHINRNRLDNRRSNLRVVSRRENGANHPGWTGASSQHRGVAFRKDTGRWTAYACVGGRKRNLGCFALEDEAAHAAQDYRREHMPGAVD